MRPGLQAVLPTRCHFFQPDPVSASRGMGPASLQEEREPEKESVEEMESYRCLLQAGSQLESTLQREC